jgi:eukaryotic-like serine/threonine-protein kinase
VVRRDDSGEPAATVTLEVVQGALRGREFSFTERGTCVIGRAGDCSPRLPDDEHHRTVSRHHCLLDINPPDIRIRDFGSKNGTFVNGDKIGQRPPHLEPGQAAALQFPERDLAHGDEIKIGQTVLQVVVRVPTVEAGPSGCAECGRPATAAYASEFVCEACQTDPGRLVSRLIEQARAGDPGLAALRDLTVERELGRGGMGAVYLARDIRSGRPLALKLMLPKVAATEQAGRQFLREIEVTRGLRHPNIALLHDYGGTRGVYFFTIEYCAAGSLDRFVQRHGGRLPSRQAVALARQVLDGLGYAHARGVVHRDLSPQNILLAGQDGALVAKACDFGLAKEFDQAGLSGLTRTGTAAGKPWFMPRQQVINFKHAKPAVDVWALAATLYWTLTGQPPRHFPPHKDPWQVVLQDDPIPIRERQPSIPRPLAEVIDGALCEGPPAGFTTAGQLRQALEALE